MLVYCRSYDYVRVTDWAFFLTGVKVGREITVSSTSILDVDDSFNFPG